MQLYSLQFVLFLLATLACYYAVGRFLRKGQWVVLLVASMGFYLATGWHNLFFILLTASSTWVVGLVFGKLEAQSKEARAAAVSREEKKAIKARFAHRKWLVLLAALLLNFGVLGYIKYWNVLLAGFGADLSFLASRILLPLGISFYTFQSISYVIDTYNAKYEPERNFARYLLFVSFFPQLIQGPINRFDEMATQLYELHAPDVENTRRALLLIAFGCMKKFAIADVLAGPISSMLDNIDPSTPGSIIAFGVLLYTIQQYGDFSGGIDMVRGVSQLFGIQMAENFRQPYFSVSLSDFWRRWHMTLGSWMRDYVFYPLAVWQPMLKLNKWGTARFGKNVGRTFSACISNIIVFLLVGLWHGAETHYVLWGLYNGIVIAVADMLRPVFASLNERLNVEAHARAWRVFCILRTFLLVNIGRYFDRLTDFGDCMRGFYNTLFNFNAAGMNDWLAVQTIPYFRTGLVLVALCCVVVFIVSVRKENGHDAAGEFLALPVGVRILVYALLGSLTIFSFAISTSTGGFLYAAF